MARAEHIGKVVIQAAASSELRPTTGLALREDATYLITGGLGGLGPESGPLAGRPWGAAPGAGRTVQPRQTRPGGSSTS